MNSNGLSLGLGRFSLLAALDGPWEVCDGDDKEGVSVKKEP
jgi:hypothetical protein